jgi:hypothetical protein
MDILQRRKLYNDLNGNTEISFYVTKEKIFKEIINNKKNFKCYVRTTNKSKSVTVYNSEKDIFISELKRLGIIIE